MTDDEIEQIAKDLEALAKERRSFAGLDGFDPRTHKAAADAYEHAATLLRRGVERAK